jgi:hypothetical protein
VQGAIHGVAMVFHVIRKLTPQECTHFALAHLDPWHCQTEDDTKSAVQTMPGSSPLVSRSWADMPNLTNGR